MHVQLLLFLLYKRRWNKRCRVNDNGQQLFNPGSEDTEETHGYTPVLPAVHQFYTRSVVCEQRRRAPWESNHSNLVTTFPEIPPGQTSLLVSLWYPDVLGQLVCVQRSSTVGVNGIPLREREYLTVPASTDTPSGT